MNLIFAFYVLRAATSAHPWASMFGMAFGLYLCFAASMALEWVVEQVEGLPYALLS